MRSTRRLAGAALERAVAVGVDPCAVQGRGIALWRRDPVARSARKRHGDDRDRNRDHRGRRATSKRRDTLSLPAARSGWTRAPSASRRGSPRRRPGRRAPRRRSPPGDGSRESGRRVAGGQVGDQRAEQIALEHDAEGDRDDEHRAGRSGEHERHGAAPGPRRAQHRQRLAPLGRRHRERLDEDEQADQAVDGRDHPQHVRQHVRGSAWLRVVAPAESCGSTPMARRPAETAAVLGAVVELDRDRRVDVEPGGEQPSRLDVRDAALVVDRADDPDDGET